MIFKKFSGGDLFFPICLCLLFEDMPGVMTFSKPILGLLRHKLS